jgi:hypothetical protein
MGCREGGKQEAQVQDSMLQQVDPLCSQKGQGDTVQYFSKKGQDSSSMVRELHLSSQPVQVLMHLEGTLGRLLIPWPQSMCSLPLLLLPGIPAGERECLQSPPWHAPGADPR